MLWFTGYVIRCVPIGTPYLQAIMETTLRARKAGKPIITSAAARDAIQWWKGFLPAAAAGGKWHGEALIPVHRTAAHTAMGDAGSEWGMGGHDDTSYYKAPWTTAMWDSVQRAKGPSSLHMEALQLLVMTRIMAKRWRGKSVDVELDSLGLTQTLRKGRHPDKRINDIMVELSQLQLTYGFDLRGLWVRRNLNEAADALSKDDMQRFWRNVDGHRVELHPTEGDLAMPRGAHSRTGGMRRTKAQRQQHDIRPVRHITAAIALSGPKQGRQLRGQLATAVNAHKVISDPLTAGRSAVNHYTRFCGRIDRHHDLTPRHPKMVTRLRMWMADAPLAYEFCGKPKKGPGHQQHRHIPDAHRQVVRPRDRAAARPAAEGRPDQRATAPDYGSLPERTTPGPRYRPRDPHGNDRAHERPPRGAGQSPESGLHPGLVRAAPPDGVHADTGPPDLRPQQTHAGERHPVLQRRDAGNRAPSAGGDPHDGQHQAVQNGLATPWGDDDHRIDRRPELPSPPHARAHDAQDSRPGRRGLPRPEVRHDAEGNEEHDPEGS